MLPPLPPKRLVFMDASPEAMLATGKTILARADPFVTYRQRSIIDVGCGYGRFAYALCDRGFEGPYFGIDVLKEQIEWLRTNFSTVCPGYEFECTDVANDRYNPSGALSSDDLQIPERYHAPDLVLLLSVFTHMYEQDLEAYLRAVASVLDEKSVVYATFFITNDNQRTAEKIGKSKFPMIHALNDHCRVANLDSPLHAISYEESWLLDRIESCGLRPKSKLYGKWCGRQGGTGFQDTLFLTKV
jgi:SAM-dependent methyltransferase